MLGSGIYQTPNKARMGYKIGLKLDAQQKNKPLYVCRERLILLELLRWIEWLEFKSNMWLFAFQIAQIPLGKA